MSLYRTPPKNPPPPSNANDSGIQLTGEQSPAGTTGSSESGTGSPPKEEIIKEDNIPEEPEPPLNDNDTETNENGNPRNPLNINDIAAENRNGDVGNLDQEPEVGRMGDNTIPVSIKYALEAVPVFTGENIPLQHFIEACEEAKGMLPANAEASFVLILRNKIRGEARRAIHGTTFATVKELLDYLKTLYAPKKTLYQLQGEMGRIFQGENESVVSYSNRVKDLASRIIEAYKLANNNAIADDVNTSFQNDFASCFKRGLKMEIEIQITVNQPLSAVIADALKIEKEIQAKENLRTDKKPGKLTSLVKRKDTNEVYMIEKQPTIICQICNKKGHTAVTCFFRIPKNNENSTRTNFFSPPKGQSQNVNPNSSGKNYGQKFNAQKEFTNQVKKIICNYCKTPGHTISECKKRIKNNARKEQFTQPSGNEPRSPRQDASRKNDLSRPVLHVQSELPESIEIMEADEAPEELEWPM